MKKRFFLFGIALVLLSGCSTRLAYNNLDWLISWYLDDYVSLTREQRERFDESVDTLLIWHRQEELGRYREHLETLADDILQGRISQQDAQRHMDLAWQHWVRLRQRVAPVLADLAFDLSEAQIEELFLSLQEQDEALLKRWHQRQNKSPAAQKRDREKDIRKEVKKRIGRLVPTQENLIAEYSEEVLSSMEQWIDYRKRLQSAALAMFEQRDDKARFVSQLTHLLTSPEQYQSDELRHLREQNRARYIDFLVAFGATLTDKQKQKLIDEIQDIISDLDVLMERT